MPQPVIAVVGPTASGKSALSLRLAQSLGGEVVNADSMQLYRGMDIGTAKLPVSQRAGVPHHLLDVWEVTKDRTDHTPVSPAWENTGSSGAARSPPDTTMALSSGRIGASTTTRLVGSVTPPS